MRWIKQALNDLLQVHLSAKSISKTGWLDPTGVEKLLGMYRDPTTNPGTRRSLDAIINHMLGVQLLHNHFIATDMPQKAKERAKELGWVV